MVNYSNNRKSEQNKEGTYERSLRSPELMKFLKKKDKTDDKEQDRFIKVKWKAYRRIVGYAIRYANKDISSSKWREVYGILVGSIEDKNIVLVKDAIPMIVGDRAGVKYENKQYVDMAQIDASIFERSIHDNKNDFIIGWWHTHPGFGFFLSPIDCLTQLGYQIPNPKAIGLIFDHTKMDSKSLGIGVLTLKNPEIGVRSSYHIIENIEYELEQSKMVKKARKIMDRVKKNNEDIIENINYIQETLINKGYYKLQEEFGLIPERNQNEVPIDEQIQRINEENVEFIWDMTDSEADYTIPKFRQDLEEELKDYHEELKKLQEDEEKGKLKQKKKKYNKKIISKLEKPTQWYLKLLSDFNDKLEKISDFFDYLDTNERKTIESFEKKLSNYHDVLEEILHWAEFSVFES
ncbi:MAG: hypothetical protein GF317_02660 [Candidatus Lokiarchaeota archaeon]|nr:hypothetical protein [Candidatus Lokiarchaeota archaeon]MBD3198808.1 hypothetical protein [Candidatus Lokiarchaeota archaeon]